MSTPALEMIACAKRELAMRARVYPAWIKSGRMSRAEAEREYRAMQSILTHLQETFLR